MSKKSEEQKLDHNDSVRKVRIDIQAAAEEAGHSHCMADYEITANALEELLVAFAGAFSADKSAVKLAETLHKAADRIAKTGGK